MRCPAPLCAEQRVRHSKVCGKCLDALGYRKLALHHHLPGAIWNAVYHFGFWRHRKFWHGFGRKSYPRKRHRPFAAALLSVRSGVTVAVILLLCAALLAALIGWQYALVLACYYVVTWTYSLRLKRVALLDVMMLAGLYTLRIIAGSAATRIELSFWLLAFSVFLFLSLGFVKRYAEIYDARKAGKLLGHGRGYGAEDLSLIMSLGTASGYCAVVVIALYINSVDSIALYHHHKTMWLICPLMLFWISRVWMLTARGHMHDDPVVFALGDRISLLVMGALGLIVLWSV